MDPTHRELGTRSLRENKFFFAPITNNLKDTFVTGENSKPASIVFI
jgi:hypothetical protein